MALNIVEGYVIDTTKPWCAPFARFVTFCHGNHIGMANLSLGVICQYVCQSVLFVQPIRSLIWLVC